MNRLPTVLLRRAPSVAFLRPAAAAAVLHGLPILPTITTRTYAKKAKKGADKFASRAPEPEAAPKSAGYDADVELSKLEGEITKISERLQEDLAKLRAGSTDPSVLGKLDVVIDKAAHTVVQLREVAHVVTKGRALAVTVYETTNVKKVISAIQIADLNMQPVLDAKNPQLVNVPLPPPTKESRLEVVEKMVAAGNKAQDGLRNARAKTRKGLQSAERDMRPDDVKKVTKRLEDVVKARKTELESVVEKAKKAAM